MFEASGAGTSVTAGEDAFALLAEFSDEIALPLHDESAQT